MNRKQRRARDKQIKKSKEAPSDIEQKLGLFDKIPENCLTCHKEFDKKNKEMVMSWNVIVREKQGIVRLYCPECWGKATQFAKEIREHGENK